MLTSITPLGERGRASRWGVTTTAYVLGSLLGGALLGTALGTVGWLLPLHGSTAVVVALVGLAVAAAVAALVELGRVPQPPGPARQVDEDWLHRYRGWVYGLGYGVQLGVGVVTIITSTTFHVTVLLAVLTGSPAGGAVVGAVFGLVRAVPVLLLWRTHTALQLAAAARRVEAGAPVVRRTAAASLAVVSLATVLQLAGSTGGA